MHPIIWSEGSSVLEWDGARNHPTRTWSFVTKWCSSSNRWFSGCLAFGVPTNKKMHLDSWRDASFEAFSSIMLLDVQSMWNSSVYFWNGLGSVTQGKWHMIYDMDLRNVAGVRHISVLYLSFSLYVCNNPTISKLATLCLEKDVNTYHLWTKG